MSNWTSWSLPNLNDLCEYDDRLRQVATEPEEIWSAVRHVVSHLDTLHDDRARVSLMGWLTDAYRVLGELDLAEQWVTRNLDFLENTDLENVAVYQIANRIRYGEVLRNADRYDAAEQVLNQAIDLIAQNPDAQSYLGYALQHLGKVYLDWSKLSMARQIIDRTEEIRAGDGNTRLIASTAAVRERLSALELGN